MVERIVVAARMMPTTDIPCFMVIFPGLTHFWYMARGFFFGPPQVQAKDSGGPRVAQFVGPSTASVPRHLLMGPVGYGLPDMAWQGKPRKHCSLGH